MAEDVLVGQDLKDKLLGRSYLSALGPQRVWSSGLHSPGERAGHLCPMRIPLDLDPPNIQMVFIVTK